MKQHVDGFKAALVHQSAAFDTIQSMIANDIKVGTAIIQIFKNHEILEVYNKTQIANLIKENTGLQQKDITYSLHRFKTFYNLTKKDYNVKKNKED